jgi:hypothetical protein
MPRPKSIPSHCHHKLSGRAYVTINGAQRYLGTYDSPQSRQTYDRTIAEWLAAGRAPELTEVGDAEGVTVTTLLAAFWAAAQTMYPAPPCAPGKRPDGELGNFYDVVKLLKRLYGNTTAAEFGPRRLRALVAEMIRLGWARNYINRTTGRVKAIFRWGVAEEMLAPAVYQALATCRRAQVRAKQCSRDRENQTGLRFRSRCDAPAPVPSRARDGRASATHRHAPG